MLARLPCLLVLTALMGCFAQGSDMRTTGARFQVLSGAGKAPEGSAEHDAISTRTRAARGLYFSYGIMHRAGAAGIAQTLARTRMNAAVLDMKDAMGRVSHRTRVKTFKPQVAHPAIDLASMVKRLKKRGVYTIARISAFNDPMLARREPERAIMDMRHPGKPWRSRSTEGAWLDPYNTDNHALVLAMAKEAEALGFDEIQLDYIRWPVDPGTKFASYPAQVDTPRYEVLRGLLRDIDRAVGIPLGVDVFGLAAKNEGDPAGLGQSLREWAPHVEVISPMLYVNAMRTWGHGSRRRAGMLIENITKRLRERVGDELVIRPFMQAFEHGADHWDGAFIREQVEGAELGQADGYLFWHPGSDYEMVARGMRGLDEALLPFARALRGGSEG